MDTLGGLRGPARTVWHDEPGVFVYEATFGGLEGFRNGIAEGPFWMALQSSG